MTRIMLTLAAVLFSTQAMAQLNEADRQFLTKDAEGAQYELAIATVAQERSERADIKAYAAKIIADHAVYNQALLELARAKGITLPTEITLEDKIKVNTLYNQARSVQDSNFVDEAIRINTEDRQAANIESAQTQGPELKAFLKRFEEMDAEHERMALMLRK